MLVSGCRTVSEKRDQIKIKIQVLKEQASCNKQILDPFFKFYFQSKKMKKFNFFIGTNFNLKSYHNRNSFLKI